MKVPRFLFWTLWTAVIVVLAAIWLALGGFANLLLAAFFIVVLALSGGAYAKYSPGGALHLYMFRMDGGIQTLRVPPEATGPLLKVLDEGSIEVDVPRGEDVLRLPE